MGYALTLPTIVKPAIKPPVSGGLFACPEVPLWQA